MSADPIATLLPAPPQAGEDSLGTAACVAALAALAAATIVSMLAPQLAQLFALAAAMLCTRYLRPLLPLALLLHAHTGSLVFASRALEAESSDYAVYFDLFTDVCIGIAPIDDTMYAFGVELGLPLLYQVLAHLGTCRLSITGLAYLQALVVSLAILIPLCMRALRGRLPHQSMLIVGGVLALFSFVYVTQLSRQAISSALLLPLLLGTHGRWTTVLLLALATLFHLTAPIVYGLALLMRSASFRGLAVAGLLGAGAALFGADLLEWALERADSFVGLAKLAYYASDAETEGAVGSDLRAIAYLLVAGLASLPLSRRIGKDVRRDAPMLLGFALLAWALLPLPLAATRLTLAFSSLAIGFYMFRALAQGHPRIAALVLMLAVLSRSGLSNVFGPSDQALWHAFPSSSWQPLYYLAAF